MIPVAKAGIKNLHFAIYHISGIISREPIIHGSNVLLVETTTVNSGEPRAHRF